MSYLLGVLNLFLLYSGGEKGSLLDVNPGLIFWTIVTFAILLIFLKKIAWKPILSALQQREDSIRSAMEKAEKERKEAEKILAENKKNLAEATEQAQRIIQEGRDFSNKLRAEVIEKANEEARKILEQAKNEIERKKDEALNELRDTVADLAIKATEKILEETVDEKKHRQIVDKFIDRLGKN
ncbi:MAG: F0F1 ATP synthase subunit B [Ignavibacteria bacterium]|nr:F0F1 ATP synthase subunit B [Ignavibacteria bacterium]